MTLGDFQNFMGQLSMLYQNWPGPIRVPAPVMNATKANTLVAQYLNRREVAVNMKNRPYYL